MDGEQQRQPTVMRGHCGVNRGYTAELPSFTEVLKGRTPTVFITLQPNTPLLLPQLQLPAPVLGARADGGGGVDVELNGWRHVGNLRADNTQ